MTQSASSLDSHITEGSVPSLIRFDGFRAILANAGALVGSVAFTTLLGFPYWWIVARSFPASSAGFAAATVSAMTLLGTIGMLGLGTLLAGELASQTRKQAAEMLATALTCATLAGLALGLAFAVLAPALLGLHALEGRAGPIFLLGVGVGLTSMTMVLDQALVGLLQGGLQLRRNIVFAISKLALLGAVVAVSLSTGGPAIYATWVIGLGTSLVWLAFVALKRGVRLRDARPRWGSVSQWRGHAARHYILNLALQAPALAMPLVVAATLSVTYSAYYYSAALVTGALAYAAIALTYALYAVGVRHKDNLAPALRFTLVLSFAVILAVNLVLAVASGWVLRLFGSAYASHAVIVLRINALGLFLMVIKDHFVAICRIRGTILRAAALCTAGAVLEIGLAALGGTTGKLSWVVLGALIALALETSVMLPTVVRELKLRRARTPYREGAQPMSS
jgi:O-antigen/teichoic acid export membrane protein